MKDTEVLHVEQYILYKEFLKECSLKKYDDAIVLHKHHIIPKCLGGDNSKSNLIKLSVEDHIKAHILLSECFDVNSKEQISNLRSARILNKNSITDKETLKRISDAFLGENNPFYGKYHSDETLKILSEATKKRLSGVSYEQRYGQRAEEQRAIRSSANKKVWESRSSEERERIAKQSGEKNKGRIPWNKGRGKTVIIDDNVFSSIREATKYYNTTRHLLFKRYKVIIEENK